MIGHAEMDVERTVMFLLLAWFVIAQYTTGTVADIHLDGNSYIDTVVTFDPDVPADDRMRTVLAAQDLFSRASKILNRAIGLHFKGVVLLFPRPWDLNRMFPGKTIESPKNCENVSSADVLVTANERDQYSVFGSGPHTLQHNSCGYKGRRITIPAEFLLNDNGSEKNAKALVKEWLKYRYGVFDESGFPNDTQYPVYYSMPGDDETNVLVSDCSNKPVEYRALHANGTTCEYRTDKNSGLPTEYCDVVPDPNTNSGVTSSLLSLQSSLNSVQKICGDRGHTHNPRSPNKHNVLCRGQSVWDILKRHSDFEQIHTIADESFVDQPIFYYVQEQFQRIVLAMDCSRGLASLQEILYNAAADMVYSLPTGAKFGYTVFQQNARTILGATETGLEDIPADMSIRNNLVLKMRPPTFSDNVNACVKCALREAINLLAPNRLKSSGTIILMTANKPLDIERDLLTSLEVSQLCLTLLLFPGVVAEDFTEILQRTECSTVFEIPAEPSIETMKQIFIALNSVVNNGWGSGPKNTMLKITELRLNSPVSFTIDKSFINFTVWISSTKIDVFGIDGQIELEPDRQQSYTKEKLLTGFNFFALNVKDSPAANWTCKLRPSTEITSVLVKVMAFEKQKHFLETQAWAEVQTGNEETNTPLQMPVKLFASIFQDRNPIINAIVTAEVKPPDGRERISLKLFDDGIGDPDITENDGIYSTYFIQFKAAGVYEVIIRVEDNHTNAKMLKSTIKGKYRCCGSKIMADTELPVEPFAREIHVHFTATNQVPSEGYGPSNITDMKITNVIRPYLFTLQWTSPGGEKNYGKAFRYDLRIFNTPEEAFQADNIGSSKTKLQMDVTPVEYGTLQTTLVNLSTNFKPNTPYYLVLRAINGKGKSSSSNVVELFLSSIIDPITTVAPNDKSTDTPSKGLSASVQIIIALTLSAVVLIVTICLIFFLYVKRKEKKDKKNPEDDRTEVKSRIRSQDNENFNRNDGSVTANDWYLERDPITPLNSVPASVLMDHHEQVQEAKRKNKDPPLFTLESFRAPKPRQPIDSDIALASSPKLPRQVKPKDINDSESVTDVAKTEEVQPNSYSDFKRRITSV